MNKAVLLIIITVLLSSYGQTTARETPDRFTKIPATAFKFDKYWINVENIGRHRNQAHITFYSVATGKFLRSQKFSLICEADKKDPVYIEDLAKQIKVYDGNNIYIKIPPGCMNCWLMPVGK